MNAAHFHLVLNHIPLLGLLFGTVLLAYGWWRAHEEVENVSLALIAFAGLSTLAVYLTGEPAEEIVEDLAHVSYDALEAHEDMGLYALWAGLLTGGSSIIALVIGALRGQLARWSVVFTLVLALGAVGLIGYTANLGGKISHPELRGEQTSHVEYGAVWQEHASAQRTTASSAQRTCLSARCS